LYQKGTNLNSRYDFLSTKWGVILYNFVTILIGFIFGLVFGSFFEYFIHKNFLHHTPRLLDQSKYIKSMCLGHSVSHHGHYLPDRHYTQDITNKEEVLTFTKYDVIFLLTGIIGLFYITSVLIRHLFNLQFAYLPPEAIGTTIAIVIYYIAYESLHVIMHVPHKGKWLRNTYFMRWLNRHHYQHHLIPSTNLNVVIPLADYLLGTKRSLPKEKYVYADAD